jgi:hypothetical protein
MPLRTAPLLRSLVYRMDQSTEFDWAERTEPGLQDLAQADEAQPGAGTGRTFGRIQDTAMRLGTENNEVK